MPTPMAVLDQVAKYGFAIGAVLFAVDIFVLDALNERSALSLGVWIVGSLLLAAKPLIGAARGFRAGLRGEQTDKG